MHRLWIGTALAIAAGCSNAPYCGMFVDITGRPVAYCPGPRDVPVCDLPDQRAHYEDGFRGLDLVGGEEASCSLAYEVVCPPGTVGEPYCITDPEL